MKKSHIITAVVVVVALVVIGWFLMPEDEVEAPENDAASSGIVEEAGGDDSTTSGVNDELDQDNDSTADVSLDISMFNFGYSSSTIEASPGDVVELVVSSEDSTHDFVIDELGVNSGLISAGDSATVTFTVPEDAAGQTYEFYCSVGSHRAQGMVGQLVVN